jgi:chemotaxis protein methyltransferase CheR
VSDRECIELLQWALPKLELRWPGFRNVRGQVCKRIAARASELGLGSLPEYRRRLEVDAAEWRELDAACHVTISRFYRDHAIFDALRERILPDLAALANARGDRALRVWSAGCASGEEPYTIAIAWHLEIESRFSPMELDLVATDCDDAVLERAARGCYQSSSLREVPDALRVAFEARDALYCVRPEMRRGVAFVRGDVRTNAPPGPFHLVLSRNVAFTYFDETSQRAFASLARERLVPGGVLVVGCHESLPTGAIGFTPDSRGRCAYVAS